MPSNLYKRSNRKMPKLSPKIILEGARLTFKTDIAFALNEQRIVERIVDWMESTGGLYMS